MASGGRPALPASMCLSIHCKTYPQAGSLLFAQPEQSYIPASMYKAENIAGIEPARMSFALQWQDQTSYQVAYVLMPSH